MPRKKEPEKKKPAFKHEAYIEGSGSIVNEQIVDVLKNNYMPYAMSVIISRALPEIDGFKPSHRKLLYMMYRKGLLNPEKDDTDTEYAIREAIRRGAMEIVVIGATGTRIDHVLGNISLLGIGLEEQIKISLVDEHNRIRMINQPLMIRKAEQYGKYVSLIPFSEKVSGVTLRGLKYPLTDYTMGGFNSLGISNEIVSDEATISFSSGELIVIESKD